MICAATKNPFERHRGTPEVRRFEILAANSFGSLAAPVLWDLAREQKYRVSPRFKNSRVMFDKDHIHRVLLTPGARDLTMAHEFGHCMHSFYWPERTDAVASYYAERVALWCEGRLVALYGGSTSYDRWISERLNGVAIRGHSGPHRKAALWLLEHINRLHPYRGGVKKPGPELLARMKEVFGG